MEALNQETQVTQIAQVIDLQERREAKQQKYSIYLEAMESLHELRSQIADYDFFMSVIALEMFGEKMPELGPQQARTCFGRAAKSSDFAEYNSADQQIQEDLNRLNGCIDALEKLVEDNKGVSLETALHLLKRQGNEENLMVLDYLAVTDCPFLVRMHEILHPVEEQKAIEKQA